VQVLRQACEILLYALILGLPFEYYFYTTTESLYTSLKLQLILFLGCWIAMKMVEAATSSSSILRELSPSLPPRLLLASFLYIVSQAVAAMLATEFRFNAAKASVKALLGVVMLIAAADLSRRGTVRRHTGVRLLIALSIAGFCTAVIGLGEHAGIRFFDSIAQIFQSSDHLVGGRVRFKSTMENPNTAAHFFVASLAAAIALATVRPASGSHLLPGLWFTAAAVQVPAIFLTYSRGALGSAVLALMTAMWVFRESFAKKWWRLAAGGTVVLLLAGIGNAVRLRYAYIEPKVAGAGNRVARYSLPVRDPVRYLSPSQEYRETIVVQNDSSTAWEGKRFGVAYRWYSFATGKASTLTEGAIFASDVLPGEERKLEVILKTPSGEGEYSFVWFISRRHSQIEEVERSYSTAQIIIIHDSKNGPAPLPTGEASRVGKILQQERDTQGRNLVPSRWNLWRAALRMFRERPWSGLGPDGFRLLKWKYMDIPGGNDTILANSLYLEYLAGSGIIGLLSLLWLLFEMGQALWAKLRQAMSPADRVTVFYGITYFVAFLLHGTVDYFLKFTPTFLLFWISLGVACASANDPDANRI
jgi:O-Antigen ligase